MADSRNNTHLSKVKPLPDLVMALRYLDRTEKFIRLGHMASRSGEAPLEEIEYEAIQQSMISALESLFDIRVSLGFAKALEG